MGDTQRIIEIAETSAIRRYNWKDRGVAPIGYTIAMALAYAYACERLSAGDCYAQAIAAALMNEAGRDVLDWYADILRQVGVSSETPADRMMAVFAVLLGLGMRESSGQYCEGRDRSANNIEADTAEAGLFQVSFNSIGAHPLLRPLFAEYRDRDDLLSEFGTGVRCGAESLKNWGEGEGCEFQALTKNCPQFAVLYAALLLRRTRKHWGPINQKKAEVTLDSVGLLRSVRQAVSAASVNTERDASDNSGALAVGRADAQLGGGDRAMLKFGDQGEELRKLVEQLRKLGFVLDGVDRFDVTVKKCVEAFQVANVDASDQPLEVDGKVGPNTRWAIEAALGLRTLDVRTSVELPGVPQGGSDAGRRALVIAMREADARHGESGSDNHGPDVRRYLNGLEREGASWCAGFVSYCFREALGHEAVFGYLVGAQAIHDRMRRLGHSYAAAMSNTPEPGDIIVWRRIDPAKPEETRWKGHVGIVHSFTNGILWTVEGNRGPYPAIVRSFRYSWSDLVTSLQGDRFKGLYGLSRHP